MVKYNTLEVQVDTSDDILDDIGSRICEVVKTEFGIEANFSIVGNEDPECEQDVVHSPMLTDILSLNYINACYDIMESEDFDSYNAAKQRAENLIASRPQGANWLALSISAANGDQLWYWDGKNEYEF